MTLRGPDVPVIGDVVVLRPGDTPGRRRLAGARCVVAQVHDFRDDPDPALYLTLVEESVYRYYMDREGGVVADWSRWHAVVDPGECMQAEPAAAVAPPVAVDAQFALFPAA